jgi:hypothetical protein
MESVELHRPSENDRDDTDLNISDDAIRIRTDSPTSNLKELFLKRSWVWIVILMLFLLISFFLFISKKQDPNKPQESQSQSQSPHSGLSPEQTKDIKVKELFGTYREADIPKNFFLECPNYPIISSTPATDSKICRWVFDHYESSEYETLWISNIKEWQIESCNRLAEPDHLKNSQKIIEQIQTLKNIDSSITWTTVDSFPTEKLKNEYELMSKLHYKRECYDDVNQIWENAVGKGFELIEPLWGYLRDPFEGQCPLTGDKLPGSKDNSRQSREYVIPIGFAPYAYTAKEGDIRSNQWRTHGIPPWRNNAIPNQISESTTFKKSRKLAMDFGTVPLNGNSSVSPSVKWLRETYHGRGGRFDHLLQIVSRKINESLLSEELPEDLRYAYVLINTHIDMDSDNSLNIFGLFKKLNVKSDDFLIFNINIDEQDVEDDFALALNTNENITNLIDEFYFEHKVKLDVMSQVWGNDMKQDLADSYNIFLGLRKKGIRSHSSP